MLRCFKPEIYLFKVWPNLKKVESLKGLAPNYRELKHPTSRQNFYDTLAQIPKLILTLCPM